MLPEEANEFDLFKKFFRVDLMLLIVHETNEYARKQSAKNWAALMRVYRDTFTVVTPEKTLPAASQAMANFSTSDDLGCRAVTQSANRTTTPTWQQRTCSRANRRPEWAVTRDRVRHVPRSANENYRRVFALTREYSESNGHSRKQQVWSQRSDLALQNGMRHVVDDLRWRVSGGLRKCQHWSYSVELVLDK